MERSRPGSERRLLIAFVLSALAVLATVGDATAAPARAASRSVAIPPTIDATGTRDVTKPLLAFFASVPDGSVVEFPYRARYRVDGTLRLENRHGLTLAGNGTLIFAKTTGDRNRRHVWFWGGSNLTVRDLAVRGANPSAGTGQYAWRADREAQHGFELSGVKRALLERVQVFNVYGDFVYLGRGPGGWAADVVVRDSHFSRNGRQGISITAGERVLITGNYIGETRQATIDLEPNGPEWGARAIRVVGNRIGSGRLYFLAAHGIGGVVEDVLVQGNQLYGKELNVTVKGSATARRANFRIIGNRSDRRWGNPGGALMGFDGVDGVEVRDNVQAFDAGRGNAGVNAVASCGVVVAGNTFTDAREHLRSSSSGCR